MMKTRWKKTGKLGRNFAAALHLADKRQAQSSSRKSLPGTKGAGVGEKKTAEGLTRAKQKKGGAAS